MRFASRLVREMTGMRQRNTGQLLAWPIKELNLHNPLECSASNSFSGLCEITKSQIYKL